MNTLKSNWRRVSLYAPLFIWIGVIFYLSGSGGSFDSTSRFVGPLLRFLFPDASTETLGIYHFFVRKSAHFWAYAVLATLAYRAFVGLKARAVAALMLVGLVAAVDETNQSFNSARTGTAGDVLIDLFGGATAILFLLLIQRIRARTTSPAPRESAQE